MERVIELVYRIEEIGNLKELTARCSDRSRKDRDSDGLCDGGWALHRVSGRWQGLPITCSSYGAVAKRLGAGPRHHGTKRVDDPADKRPVRE